MVCDHGHDGQDNGWATTADLLVWLAPFFERSGQYINSYVQNLYVSDRWCQDAQITRGVNCQISVAQHPLAVLSS
jgi:hypothetical protein